MPWKMNNHIFDKIQYTFFLHPHQSVVKYNFFLQHLALSIAALWTVFPCFLFIGMVLTLDGNSEIGAHLGINPCFFLFVLGIQEQLQIRFFSEKTYFPSCVRTIF